eukprot:g45116.t1
MADEPPAPEEPEQPRQEDPEVKTLAENLGDLLIGRITLGNIPKELGGNKQSPVKVPSDMKNRPMISDAKYWVKLDK